MQNALTAEPNSRWPARTRQSPAKVSPDNTAKPVIWYLLDGKPGHDNQSIGLVRAIEKLVPCNTYQVSIIAGKLDNLCWLIDKRFPPGTNLPDPDLIIGAGHHLHLAMLAAKRARGGKTVVLMKPGLPVSWFDLCLVPEHDHPPEHTHIFKTTGPINRVNPASRSDQRQGLILIGGPSRHFDWDNKNLLQQINTIVQQSGDMHWQITDSRRTPEITRAEIMNLRLPNLEFCPSSSTGREWLPEQLSHAHQVWVSEDSMSMVFEALSSGAHTGLIRVPTRRKNKISDCLEIMLNDGQLQMLSADMLSVPDFSKHPPVILAEANRCAEEIKQRFLPDVTSVK